MSDVAGHVAPALPGGTSPQSEAAWLGDDMERLALLVPEVGGLGMGDPVAVALAFVERYRHDVLQLEREWPFVQAALVAAWRRDDFAAVARLAEGAASLAGRMALDEAQHLLGLGIAACRRSRDWQRLAPLVNRLGGVLYANGRCEDGQRLWHAGIELARSSSGDAAAGLWEPFTSFTYVADLVGSHAAARRLVAAVSRTCRGDDPDSLAAAHFVRAFRARVDHDMDAAYDDLRACLRLLSLSAPDAAPAPQRHLFMMAAQVELARVQGQYARAQDDAESALALAHVFGDRYTAAALLIDQMWFAAVLGHLADARATFLRLRAVARGGRTQPPIVAVACRAFEQRMCRAAVESRPLFRHGRAPNAPTPAHAVIVAAEPLSERELEVLRLVAAGLANREIAGRLIVTTGTVKKHLEHIYAKLDVRSRTAAVARATALGLLG